MNQTTPTTGNRGTRRRPGSGSWRDRGWKQLSYRLPEPQLNRIKAQAGRLDIADIDYIDRAVLEKLDRDEAAQAER